MKNLPLTKLSPKDHLLFPDELFDVGLHTSANQLMIDFRKEHPPIIDSHILAQEAQSIIQKLHASYLMVTDEDKELVGLISPHELSEEAIMKRILNGESRSQITVADLMIAREAVPAVKYESIMRATVAEVVHTLQTLGEQYLLVLDTKTDSICGLFSASELSRRLHQPIHISQRLSFADLVAAIGH